MKKSTSLLVAIIVIVTTLNTTAQSGFSALIKSGPADATKLVDAYGEPLFKRGGSV